MISSVNLPKFGSSQINQNKAMEKPDFKGETPAADTDKNVNYKDWAKKNATKIALGATALAGVVAAGILLRGRGSSKVNNLTDDLQEGATQALNNTLEKFRQEGNIFRKGVAITKDGERYTGELVHTKKDGSNVTMTFENGFLTNSKIVKDGETVVDKSYDFSEMNDKLRKLSINGKDTEVWHSWDDFPLPRDNVRGGSMDATMIIPDKEADRMQTPEYVNICGKKLKLSRDYIDFGDPSCLPNLTPKTMQLNMEYRSRDLDNPHNRFEMTSSFKFVEGKNYPTCFPKEFVLNLQKFKDNFGKINVDSGIFSSTKKKADLFKYNYHTKEISELNGISKEDAQEMVDFWERHYAASKKILGVRSYAARNAK